MSRRLLVSSQAITRTTTNSGNKTTPIKTTKQQRRLLLCTPESGVGDKTRTTATRKRQQLPLYLHIGPAGDAWTGTELFAAKHLQPDYVKSILLPPLHLDEGDDADDYSTATTEALIHAIEQDTALARQIYDEAQIPPSLLESVLLTEGDTTTQS